MLRQVERETGVKARLFNVKYSPNLGDGLLSECLEAALVEHGAGKAGTFSVDLGGREAYAPGSTGRGKVLGALQATPPFIRRNAMRAVLCAFSNLRWVPHYKANLDGADAVVIGGGNLFTDMDLNFPVKIASVLDVARDRGLRSAIYGVGVSPEWSRPGRDMVRKALKKAAPRYVSVRDEASKRAFDDLFADAAGREAVVVRDPGLMVSRYVARQAAGEGRAVAGLCVTSAVAVNYHSSLLTQERDLDAWYLGLAERLAASHDEVVLFTNGSPEDIEVLERLRAGLAQATGGKGSFHRPTTPTELARLVSGFDFLVAHRMHALIAAYSYGVPVFALEWDRKVNAFMDSVGLGDRVARASGDTFEAVAEAASRLEPVKGHEVVVAQAFADVAPLARAIAA